MCTTTLEQAQMQLEIERNKIPQKVNFEVQDDFVKSLPQILSNIEEIKVWAKARTQLDKNAVLVSDDDFKQAEERCAQYNKIIKAIDNKRKDVKKAYVQPLEVFEKAINETKAILTEAKDNLWSQVKQVENDRSSEKLDKLTTYWERTLDTAVTSYRKFTDIADTKWLNKGVSFATAFGEMDKSYQQIENDLQAINAVVANTDSTYLNVLLAYYKEGHSLSETLAYYNRIQQSRKNIAVAEKEQAQQNTQIDDKQSVQAERTAEIDENEPLYEIVFKVSGTKAQIAALAEYMRTNKIKYDRP